MARLSEACHCFLPLCLAVHRIIAVLVLTPKRVNAGDTGRIEIGDGSNLQDGVTVRTSRASLGSKGLGTTIGQGVTIGHGASLTGATVEDGCLIGMNATLLEGSKVLLLRPMQ